LLKVACLEQALLLTAKRLPLTKRKWSIQPEEVA
jgi:hypothetical protein